MNQNKVAQKRALLQKHYEMACHNLLCYSRSYLMEQAKEGFEAEWKEAQAECELLQEMMVELDAQEQKEAVQEVPVLEQLKVVKVFSFGIRSLGKLFRHSLLHDYVGSKLKIKHETDDHILIFDLKDRFIGDATAVEG